MAAPTVTKITATAGPLAGGTKLTITGTNLAKATEVLFGDTAARITRESATRIAVVAPAGTAGTVDVTVVTAGGTSATSPADEFTYAAAPTITELSPATGPISAGTSVTITGMNLANATEVLFGDKRGQITSDTGTQIVVVAPAGAAGVVNVKVVTAGGTSAASRPTRSPIRPRKR